MKALLVAIPVLFAAFLILGRFGSAGLGVVELGILAGLAILWVGRPGGPPAAQVGATLARDVLGNREVRRTAPANTSRSGGYRSASALKAPQSLEDDAGLCALERAAVLLA